MQTGVAHPVCDVSGWVFEPERLEVARRAQGRPPAAALEGVRTSEGPAATRGRCVRRGGLKTRFPDFKSRLLRFSGIGLQQFPGRARIPDGGTPYARVPRHARGAACASSQRQVSPPIDPASLSHRALCICVPTMRRGAGGRALSRVGGAQQGPAARFHFYAAAPAGWKVLRFRLRCDGVTVTRDQCAQYFPGVEALNALDYLRDVEA